MTGSPGAAPQRRRSDSLRRETISANFPVGDVEREADDLQQLFPGTKARREAGKIVLYRQGE